MHRRDWRIVKEAAAAVGCTHLEIVSEKKHVVVKLSTPNDERRTTSFSGSSSDINFERAVKRQLKRLAEGKE